jgi:hypothetical protein
VPEKLHILYYNVLISLISPPAVLGLYTSIWLVLPAIALFIVLFVKRLVLADTIHLSVATYMGVVLCWAWPPSRFVAVVLPLVLLFIWRAIEAITPSWILRYWAVAIVSLVSCLCLANDVRRIPQTVSSGQFPIGSEPNDEWPELKKMFSWLRVNARQDTVVLANLDPVFFLYTDRKSTRSFVANSYKLFYVSGAPTDDSVGSLEEIIGMTGASFLVMTPDTGFAEIPIVRRELARYRDTHPGKLERVDRPGTDPKYQIYRIRP